MGARKTKRGVASASAIAFAVALVCANVASADRPRETLISGFGSQEGFSIDAGHGYSVDVVSGHGKRVSAAIQRSSGAQIAVADYSVEGRVSSNVLRADFGALGKISVSFHPSGRVQVRPPPENCEGKPEVITKGIFSGTIRLRLEDGSLSVDTDRAPGDITRSPKLHCHEGGGGGDGGGKSPVGPGSLEEVDLSAYDCNGTSVDASQISMDSKGNPVPGSPNRFVASSFETRGRVRIVRLVALLSVKSPFTYAPDLSSATLQPPPPFSGSAEFNRDPATGEGIWTGSLAVDFPGRRVALVGPGIEARLTRTKLFAGTFTVIKVNCPRH